MVVDRKNAQGLTDLTMAQVIQDGCKQVTCLCGVADSNKGYLLVKVSKVENVLPVDESDKQAKKIELQSALALEYVSAYMKSLKAKGQDQRQSAIIEWRANQPVVDSA